MDIKQMGIEEESTLCRAAMKDTKSGDLVWFCHHELPLEHLTEPPEKRIEYILKYKPENEQAIRLHWFRPFTGRIPKWLKGKLEACEQAREACEQAWVACEQAWVAYRQAQEACVCKHLKSIPTLLKNTYRIVPGMEKSWYK